MQPLRPSGRRYPGSRLNPFIVLPTTQGNGRRPLWMWFAGVAAFALLAAALAVLVIRPRLATWARNYVIRRLEIRYDAKVELHNLQFALYPRVRATDQG